MEKNIAVLPGDGIGPEVTAQAMKVLKVIAERFHHRFHFKTGLIGAAAIEAGGNPYPDETHELCKSADAILFGAIGDPKYDNNPKAKVRPEQGLLAMRRQLSLFANIRPVHTYKSLLDKSPLKADIISGTDFVVYRELTGGIYFGEKKRSADGQQASDDCTYTRSEIERISIKAFDNAMARRKKLTLVDKANVLETSRLWREVVQAIAPRYPEVEVNFMFVDNAAMQLILNPRQFDVILTENMFGDIITDEASVITGSLGMLPSASVGEISALYEPIHGSYPSAAGKNIANPIGSVLSAAMMLELSFGMTIEAAYIHRAVEECLKQGWVTQDIDPVNYIGTSDLGDRIAEQVNEISLHQV